VQESQTVTAQAGGRAVKQVRLPSNGSERTIAIPLKNQGPRCSVILGVSPTGVPAQALGIPDNRELGARIVRVAYEPSTRPKRA
jgi:hypothetical protein